MIGECTEVPNMDSSTQGRKMPIQGPPSKKMKQARLPFKLLDPKATAVSPVPSLGKKRKLSDQEVPLSKISKSLKADEKKPNNKEPGPIATEENEVSSSSETENHSKVERCEAKLTKKSGLIENFLCKSQPSNDIVHSTSDVIDLTEHDTNADKKEDSKVKTDEEKENVRKDDIKAISLNEVSVAMEVNTTPNSKSASKESAVEEDADIIVLPSESTENNQTDSVPSTASALEMSSPVTPVSRKKSLATTSATTPGSSEMPSPVTPVSSRKLLATTSATTPGSSEMSSPVTPVSSRKPIATTSATNPGPSEMPSPVTPVSSRKPIATTSATTPGSTCPVTPVSTPIVASPSLTSPDSSGVMDKSFTGSTPGSAQPKRKHASSTKKEEKEAERKRKQEEREHERQQKLKQKEEEKAEKERIKKEEKERKEAEKEEARLKKEKEKQEKREQQEKEKMEKLKMKEEEKKKKQEVIDAKNEEKRQKEEEKKKKEEEKSKEEEDKRKKKEKEQKFLKSFFIKPAKGAVEEKSDKINSGPFMQFEVKKDMRLAPTIRREPIDIDITDNILTKQTLEKLYLDELRDGKSKGTSAQTFPMENKEEDQVEVIEAKEGGEVMKKRYMKAKFLKFAENTRPAFRGTWRKKSSKLSPRNYLKTDEDLFDYEVDSDEEWEEEEPGESLSHSEGEDEDGEANGGDDEEEDGFFVPHGYLSEDEGCEEDDELTPEKMKARQLAKAEQWESQMKEKCKPMKPICIGCVWTGEDNKEELLKTLLKYQVAALVSTPIHTRFSKIPKEGNTPTGAEKTANSANKNKNNHTLKRPVPEEAIPDLIRLVHGNVHSVQKLIREFKQFWQVKSQQSKGEASNNESVEERKDEEMEVDATEKEKDSPSAKNGFISKRQLDLKIKEIADYKKQEGFKKKCWYVNPSVLEKYKLTDLPIPCQWEYLIKFNKKEVVEEKEPVQATPTGGITQFTIPVSPGEALRALPFNMSGSPLTPRVDTSPPGSQADSSQTTAAAPTHANHSGLSSTPERSIQKSVKASSLSTPGGQSGQAVTPTQGKKAEIMDCSVVLTPVTKSVEPKVKTTPHRSIADFMKAATPAVLFKQNKGNTESANNKAVAPNADNFANEQDEIQPMDVDMSCNTVSESKEDEIMIIDEVLPGKS